MIRKHLRGPSVELERLMEREKLGPYDQDDRIAPGSATSAFPSKLALFARRRIALLAAPGMIVVTALLLFAAIQHAELLRLVSPSVSKSASGIKNETCPDPYSSPGYLLHSPIEGTARWIPFSNDPDGSDATIKNPQTRNDTDMPDYALKAAPKAYMFALRDKATRAINPDLAWLRNRRILLLGCSLDRYFLYSFCETHQGEMTNPGNWQGLFACTIPELNFEMQLWFTFGGLAPPEAKEGDQPVNFERRIREYWRPLSIKEGREMDPDLIVWASGTWDYLGLRRGYAEQPGWKEQGISWQELAWHRRRLGEEADFIHEEFPDVPAMYRPPTYVYKKGLPSDNYYLKGMELDDIDFLEESVYRVHQSADFFSKQKNVPIFRWAEKLVGSRDFSDTVHYSTGSSAQWLYGEMLLYYLKHYTSPLQSHCLTQA